jgi:Flp pilus assembly protein protease CpaA
LFSAAGASLGFWHTLEAAAMAALAGAVLSVGWMLWQYGMRRTVETFALATVSPRILDRPQESVRDSQRHIPYCLALAVGLLVAGWFPKLLF